MRRLLRSPSCSRATTGRIEIFSVNRGFLSVLIDVGAGEVEDGKDGAGKGRYLRVITTHVAPSSNVAGGTAALIEGIVTAARDAQIAELVAYIREVRSSDAKRFGGEIATVLAGDVNASIRWPDQAPMIGKRFAIESKKSNPMAAAVAEDDGKDSASSSNGGAGMKLGKIVDANPEDAPKGSVFEVLTTQLGEIGMSNPLAWRSFPTFGFLGDGGAGQGTGAEDDVAETLLSSGNVVGERALDDMVFVSPEGGARERGDGAASVVNTAARGRKQPDEEGPWTHLSDHWGIEVTLF